MSTTISTTELRVSQSTDQWLASFDNHRELKRERAWSRIHLVPVMLAEADRDAYRRNEAQVAREKEIMKDVPGWEAGKSVYNTKRYTPPNFVVL